MTKRITWDSELREMVRKNWRVAQAFTLNDVYRLEPLFQSLYPRNRHRRDKLRQTLQHLRDEGELEFVDNKGHYRRLR